MAREMTQEEEKMQKLADTFSLLRIPVGYEVFPDEEETEMPYLVYRTRPTSNFFADGGVYDVILAVDVIICADELSPELEEQLEGLIYEELSVGWRKEREYDENDVYFGTSYTFEY